MWTRLAAIALTVVACSSGGGGGGVDKPEPPALDGSVPPGPPPTDGGGPNVDGGAVPIGLSYVAGQLGGEGNLDGTATDSRLSVGGLRFDPVSGSLYLRQISFLRKIDVASKSLLTVAGQDPIASTNPFVDGVGAAAGIRETGFLASATIDSAQRKMYFADSATLRVLDLPTGAVTTITGKYREFANVDGDKAVARLFDPTGLAVLYCGRADDVNTEIGEVGVVELGTMTKRVIAKVAGRDIALDEAKGKLYARSRSLVREVDIVTGTVTAFVGRTFTANAVEGAADKISFGPNPTGVATDVADKRAFVADGQSVRVVDLETGAVKLLAGYPDTRVHADGPRGTGGFFSMRGMAYAPPSKKLYVADYTTIRAVDTTTGALETVAIRCKPAPSTGQRSRAVSAEPSSSLTATTAWSTSPTQGWSGSSIRHRTSSPRCAVRRTRTASRSIRSGTRSTSPTAWSSNRSTARPGA